MKTIMVKGNNGKWEQINLYQNNDNWFADRHIDVDKITDIKLIDDSEFKQPKTQDRTIRDVKSIVEELSRLYLKFLEEEATGVQVNYWSNDRVNELVSKLELKQPEKKEIEKIDVDFTMPFYSERDMRIKLNEVIEAVNRLLEE